MVLELKNISKTYDGFKLDNISFEIPEGCIMGLIGENGAGKSTTMKLILDLISPDKTNDESYIKFFGQNGYTKAVREDVGVVMDECSFPRALTPKQIRNVLASIYTKWNDETFDYYMKKFNLPYNKIVKGFSKGMKMKLSIAAALSHSPKLLILDEATTGLDLIIRNEILDEFIDFVDGTGNSVLISSHIVSDLEKTCDKIACIHNGKLLFCEDKKELLSKYETVEHRKDGRRKCDIELVEKGSVPNARATTLEDIIMTRLKKEVD